MAPVSVTPELQRQGIGTALIKAGLEAMRRGGAHGVAVVGNPAYYERFGFAILPGLHPFTEQDAPYFRAKAFVEPAPVGVLRYALAFG
jgi:putative acetyltransferase